MQLGSADSEPFPLNSGIENKIVRDPLKQVVVFFRIPVNITCPGLVGRYV
jgi:hypothetical protein